MLIWEGQTGSLFWVYMYVLSPTKQINIFTLTGIGWSSHDHHISNYLWALHPCIGYTRRTAPPMCQLSRLECLLMQDRVSCYCIHTEHIQAVGCSPVEEFCTVLVLHLECKPHISSPYMSCSKPVHCLCLGLQCLGVTNK